MLLDTNVISELMRASPEPRVVAWLDARPESDLWICAITVAEIRLGLALLPDGARKAALAERAEAMLDDDFGNRCLPFDAKAGGRYGSVVAARLRQGRPISVEDAQIAAIAIEANVTLATRNTGDFEGIEALTVVNPWKADHDGGGI